MMAHGTPTGLDGTQEHLQAAEMTFGSMMTIPGDLLRAPMQAELNQTEAKEFLRALQ